MKKQCNKYIMCVCTVRAVAQLHQRLKSMFFEKFSSLRRPLNSRSIRKDLKKTLILAFEANSAVFLNCRLHLAPKKSQGVGKIRKRKCESQVKKNIKKNKKCYNLKKNNYKIFFNLYDFFSDYYVPSFLNVFFDDQKTRKRVQSK